MATRVGNRLKKLRGNRTQTEVAKALGISVSAVSSYENGERIPRDPLKKKIAKFYDTDISIFF